jgi:preprotein translocase SecE subunit
MAVVTKDDGKEPLFDDEESGRPEETRAKSKREDRERDSAEGGGGAGPTAPLVATGGGFFSLYKPGQGYWTRMGTAAAAALLIALLARFLYMTLSTKTMLDIVIDATGKETRLFPKIKLMITGGFVLMMAIVAWYYMNKPRVVDFLIATESEMKKVNWTSRKELIGSTKVVIIFMFMIAFFLAFVDLFFAWLFYLIKVLDTAPFK